MSIAVKHMIRKDVDPFSLSLSEHHVVALDAQRGMPIIPLAQYNRYAENLSEGDSGKKAIWIFEY